MTPEFTALIAQIEAEHKLHHEGRHDQFIRMISRAWPQIRAALLALDAEAGELRRALLELEQTDNTMDNIFDWFERHKVLMDRAREGGKHEHE